MLHGGGTPIVSPPPATIGRWLTVDHRELRSGLQMDPKFLRNQVRVGSY